MTCPCYATGAWCPWCLAVAVHTRPVPQPLEVEVITGRGELHEIARAEALALEDGVSPEPRTGARSQVRNPEADGSRQGDALDFALQTGTPAPDDARDGFGGSGAVAGHQTSARGIAATDVAPDGAETGRCEPCGPQRSHTNPRKPNGPDETDGTGTCPEKLLRY